MDEIPLKPHQAWYLFVNGHVGKKLSLDPLHEGPLIGYDNVHKRDVTRIQRWLETLPSDTRVTLVDSPSPFCPACPQNINGRRFNSKKYGDFPCDPNGERVQRDDLTFKRLLQEHLGTELTVGMLQQKKK